jgi:glutamate-1-semialdehyde 2,1-aminomutase
LTLTFTYNDIASLEQLFAQHPKDIACVIMEGKTIEEPKENFLLKVQDACKKNGAVFILDEMITGFRYGFPSIQKQHKLSPDLSTYGKGIANGYSLAVLAGKKDIMERGGLMHDKERVFLISTTHGAETTALAAALASIKEMKQKKVQPHMWRMGTVLKRGLEKLIKQHNLTGKVEVFGFPCNLAMNFRGDDGQPSWGLRTLFLQEVIKRGILFQGYFAMSFSHKAAEIKKTLSVFDEVMGVYADMLQDGGYEKHLIGAPIKPVFRKRN